MTHSSDLLPSPNVRESPNTALAEGGGAGLQADLKRVGLVAEGETATVTEPSSAAVQPAVGAEA